MKRVRGRRKPKPVAFREQRPLVQVLLTFAGYLASAHSLIGHETSLMKCDCEVAQAWRKRMADAAMAQESWKTE